MFAADLSWTEDRQETVGHRKQRKAREARNSVSSGSDSLRSQKQQERSRPPQWKLSLPFSKSKKVSMKHEDLSKESVVNYLNTLPQPRKFVPIDTRSISTSTVQDDDQIRYASGESSLAELDQLKSQILALQAQRYQGLKSATSSIFDFASVKDTRSQQGDYPPPELSPTSTAFDRDVFCRRSTSNPQAPDGTVMVQKSITVTVESSPPATVTPDQPSSPEARSPESEIASPTSPLPGKRSMWAAPTDWGVQIDNSSRRARNDISRPMSPVKETSKVATKQQDKTSPESNAILRHFRRMIRRMEAAKPSVILDRLEEEWGSSDDPVVVEELQVEKLLWAISALEKETLVMFLEKTEGRINSQLLRHTRRATNLLFDATIADVYRTAHANPDFKMTYVSASPMSPHAKSHIAPVVSKHISLNPDSSGLGIVSFPLALPASSITQIFTSKLPSLLPSSAIPSFLAECFRLLESGGSLELRLINALPERVSSGPKLAAWLEDHLMIQLEAECRCSRPCNVIPTWANTAGFRMIDGGRASLSHVHKLHAVESEDAAVESLVGAAVLREVWKDVWGSCIRFEDDEKRMYWWEDDEILEECREMKTTWRVSKFVVFKPL